MEEVKHYSEAFWEKYVLIPDHEKIIAAIERGEARLKKIEETQAMLTRKIGNQSLDELTINYTGQTKGKQFTEEEDKFMLIVLEKFGYGREDVYEKIREEIRKCPLFRFDWFIRTRTVQEISKRCHTLVSLIEKEHDEKSLKKRNSEVAPKKPKVKKPKNEIVVQ